jgi:hemoglobin
LTVVRDVTIRVAIPADREALEALQWRASLSNAEDREALLAHPDAIELPLSQIEAGGVFVAESEGSIGGFAAILSREDGDAELDALFVEPDRWRQGIGRLLVEYCCASAMASNASAMRVIGNPHAEGFYVACGFHVLGTEATRFGVGLVMRRDLINMPEKRNLTIYDAAGGHDGLLKLAHAWHRCVLHDEVVSHAFSHGYHPQHTERLAAYWAEALGGPAMYSGRHGDETSVVRMHSGNGEHDEMNRRAIACFDQALADAGFAGDERLCRVLHDYFAWATNTTMSRYHVSADDVPAGLRISRWSWEGLVEEA